MTGAGLLVALPFERRVHQRCLAGAGLADQHGDPLRPQMP